MKYTPFFGCMMITKYPQFEAAVRKSVAKVGMELVDVDGFSCCPDPIYFHASNKMDWYTVAARNISLAEDVGRDIITTCSGCTATLSEVNLALKEDSSLKDEINKSLKKIGRKFKGTVNVRHAVTVLRDDFGMDRIVVGENICPRLTPTTDTCDWNEVTRCSEFPQHYLYNLVKEQSND